MKPRHGIPRAALFPRLPKKRYRVGAAAVFALVAAMVTIGLAWFAGCSGFTDTVHYVVTGGDLPTACKSEVALKWASISAKTVWVAAIIALVLGVVAEAARGRWYGWFARNHTVICGLGWQGRAFVVQREQTGADTATIAIEIAADDAAAEFCRRYGAHLMRGNADHIGYLRACRVQHAERVMICTGDQDENLRIAAGVRDYANRHRQSSVPLKVQVSLGAALTDGASSGALFAGLLKSTPQCHISIYDPDQRMARVFYYHHPVYQWAAERSTAAAADVRVHLVFLGFSRLAGELILQYARIWPCAGQQPPRFTVVCREAQRVQAFLRRNAVLDPHAVVVDYPDFEADDLAGRVEIVERDRNTCELLDAALMAKLSAPPVTAVICCADHHQTSIQCASQCHLLAQRNQCWPVPVLAEMEKREGTEALLSLSRQQPDPATQIIPFGSPMQYCDLQLLDYMDSLAAGIHEDYREQYGIVAGDGRQMPANQPWNTLDYHLQRSNFRAADHVLPKLYSAGFRWRGLAPTLGPNTTLAGATRMLAELEHRSWMCEKLVAGYRNGPRDDTRLFHPSVKPWSVLEASEKAKDARQVNVVEHILKTTSNADEQLAPTAARAIRIALIGHIAITPEQSDHCRRQIQQTIATWCTTQNSDWLWLDFLTPLAPGSDCALMRGALDQIQSAIWKNGTANAAYPLAGYRLIMPIALPWDKVDDDFRDSWQNGVDWLDSPHSVSNYDIDKAIAMETASRQKRGQNPADADIKAIVRAATWRFFKHDISVERQHLINRAQLSTIVPLHSSAADERHADRYQRASDYMLEQADRLVAVLDPARDIDGAPKGGTAASVAHWRAMIANGDRPGGSLTLINPHGDSSPTVH